MTKEEGLSLNATAHSLRPHEMRPSRASIEGDRATNKFKEFNADRMVTVRFDPSQKVKESKEPVTSKNILGMVSGVIAAILTILLIVCIVMGYRYRAASIEGEWTSPTFSEKMLTTLKDTASTKNKVSNALPQGQDLITDINTTMNITDNKAHLKVSFVYNRKGFYQAYQSRVNELKGQYGEEFLEIFDSNSLSEEDYYKQFDETVKKELPKSYTYDSKTGRVTTTAFTGEINRWEQTITVDKAGVSDAFKKGDILDYTPNNGGFTIKGHSEFGDISFTKNT